jgi:quercetin dioxygenase-like cupin family protein
MSRIAKPEEAGAAASQVFDLQAMINYQPCSVVSREIVSRKAGTVTVFAFDEGGRLSEHTAPFDAMVFAIEGEAEVFIAGEPYRLRKGDMIIMPAGVPHALNSIGKFKMLLVMIRE